MRYAGATTTRFLEGLPTFRPHAVEIVSPGMGTTVQVNIINEELNLELSEIHIEYHSK